MSNHTITIDEVRDMIAEGVTSFSKKADTPRGCETVSASKIKVGDEILINNYFTLVV